MNKSEEYPCANCGKLKSHPPRIVKRNENLFCSRRCYDEFQNTSLKLECSICGNKFLRQKAQYEKQNNHYCSVKCRNKGIDKRVLKKCTECDKEIKVHKYKIENSESGNHFCSKNGEDRLKQTQELDKKKNVLCEKKGQNCIEQM